MTDCLVLPQDAPKVLLSNTSDACRAQGGSGDPFPGGFGALGSSEVHLGDVADVDNREPDLGNSGILGPQDPFDHFDRAGEVLIQRCAEHEHGVDGGELDVGGLVLDVVPRGPFGQCLGLPVGVETGVVDVGPVVFVEAAVGSGRASGDGDR